MAYEFTEIDHLLGAVSDPHAGGDQYERLGFTVTPISIIANMGVGNRLVLLKPRTENTASFFECMGIVDRSMVPPGMEKMLTGCEGLRSMVLATPDATRSYRKLSADGFPFDPPVEVERDWRLPSGEILSPSFRVTIPIDAPLPFNFCQYHTLHCYLREQWLEHENGAQHLVGVLALADDVRAVSRYFERVFGAKAHVRDGVATVSPGRVDLKIGDRRGLVAMVPIDWLPEVVEKPRYVGFEVSVSSLASLQKLLAGNEIPFAEYGGAINVGPADACGNILRFVESTVS